MRFLFTSYHKSGTHQAYPMFMDQIPHIVDHSNIQFLGADKWGMPASRFPNPRYTETIDELRSFTGKRFGHVAYMKEYGDAIRAKPTKVILNVRDPRDVVIAEYENIKIKMRTGPGLGMWNIHFAEYGKLLSEMDDPIAILIELAAIRWPHWLGWLDHDFTYLLHFEDLRDKTTQTVQSVRGFLAGIPLMSEISMVKSVRNKNVPTFRKGLVGEHRNYFTDYHWELSDRLLLPIMERMGYNREGRFA